MTDVPRIEAGRVRALAIRSAKGVPPELRDTLELSAKDGVVDDHGTKERRQITLMSAAAWDATTKDLGQDVHWTARRANVLVEGLDFERSKGFNVRIGDVVVEVLGETVPCSLMDEHTQGLREALVPGLRGGVYGRIVVAGTIAVGDPVTVTTVGTKLESPAS